MILDLDMIAFRCICGVSAFLCFINAKQLFHYGKGRNSEKRQAMATRLTLGIQERIIRLTPSEQKLAAVLLAN